MIKTLKSVIKPFAFAIFIPLSIPVAVTLLNQPSNAVLYLIAGMFIFGAVKAFDLLQQAKKETK